MFKSNKSLKPKVIEFIIINICFAFYFYNIKLTYTRKTKNIQTLKFSNQNYKGFRLSTNNNILNRKQQTLKFSNKNYNRNQNIQTLKFSTQMYTDLVFF